MARYDRPVWPVTTCGRFSAEVDDWEKEIKEMSVNLTEEEKNLNMQNISIWDRQNRQKKIFWPLSVDNSWGYPK